MRAAERAVAEIGSARPIEPTLWSALRTVEPHGGVAVRLGGLPASLAPVWSKAVRVTAAVGGCCHATVTRGVVRCVVPPAATPEEIARTRGIMKELQAPGSRIVERAPEPLWPEVPSTSADSLSRDVRRTFDPDRVLNPGILDPTA